MEKNERKRKWEREYEKYSSSAELEERIEYLTDLTNGKVAMKEEYAELKRLTAIKENLPKVKNILELRGKLQEQREEINAEIKRREYNEKLDKATQKLEDEMKKLEEEYDNLQSELKKPELEPEKKAELQAKLAENANKRQENNKNFGKCQDEIKVQKSNSENNKFKDMTTEDLKNQATNISSNISQCNFACNRLMQGYSWQSIDVALDKFKGEKLTAKGPQAAKMEQNREAAKAANVKGKTEPAKEAKTEESKSDEPKTIVWRSKFADEKSQEDEEENSLANLTLWQKAKNWVKGTVAKIKSRFQGEEEVEEVVEQDEKSLWEKMKDKINQLRGIEEELEPEKKPLVKPTAPKQKTEQEVEAETEWEKQCKEAVQEEKPEKESNTFRQYLKEVAEKGVDGVEQEQKEAKRQAAIEKLKANREGKDSGAIVTKLDKEIAGQSDDCR